jgi:hypothetical protein
MVTHWKKAFETLMPLDAVVLFVASSHARLFSCAFWSVARRQQEQARAALSRLALDRLYLWQGKDCHHKRFVL